MTVYAKCPEDLDTAYTTYLTPGKLYVVADARGCSFQIRDDFGKARFCLWSGCAHLAPSGGYWERVEKEDEA